MESHLANPVEEPLDKNSCKPFDDIMKILKGKTYGDATALLDLIKSQLEHEAIIR